MKRYNVILDNNLARIYGEQVSREYVSPQGKWVRYSDVEKLIIKLTQSDEWNSPSIIPLDDPGYEFEVMDIKGEKHPAAYNYKSFVKLAGYPYEFPNQHDIIKWRYDK